MHRRPRTRNIDRWNHGSRKVHAIHKAEPTRAAAPPISFDCLYIDSHIIAYIHFLEHYLAFHRSSDLSRMFPMSIILTSFGVYKPHPTGHRFSFSIPQSTYRYTYLVATNINATAYCNPTPCPPCHTLLHVHPLLPRTPTRLAG